jgi:hypothetical protein
MITPTHQDPSFIGPTVLGSILAKKKLINRRSAEAVLAKPKPGIGTHEFRKSWRNMVWLAAAEKQFIKENFTTSWRAMIRLAAEQQFREKRNSERQRRYTDLISMQEIAAEVFEKYKSLDVSYSDLFSIRRKKQHVLARQECFYRVKMETSRSLPEIGRFFGGKDHTTILHGIRQYRIYQDAAAGKVDWPHQAKSWVNPEWIIDPSIYEVGQ